MSMGTKLTGVAALAAITMAAAGMTQLTLQPESRLWVAGGSTVRDYKCNTQTFDADIMAPGATANLTLAELVRSAEVEIPVAELECGNGTMNDHMRKALKAKEHPRIVFKLVSYTVTDTQLRLSGTLNIAGTERPVELVGQVREENGIVRAAASAQIEMTAWGVKPPSLMLGTMKVKDAVTIAFDVALQR